MGSVFAGMVALALRGRLSPVKGVGGGAAGIVALDYGVVEPIGKGLPMQVYSRRYMSQVNKAMSIIADEKGLDPNDVSGRNSRAILRKCRQGLNHTSKTCPNFGQAASSW